MNTDNPIPDDLDGETALALADILYALGDEVLNRNCYALRDHYRELDEMRRQSLAGNPEQLSFPWLVHHHLTF
jgi:hypothetical protein